jgi:tRNA(Ile)-lysidine synthase
MGPHPAVAEIRSAVREVLRGPVLVACSGGADSLALAAATAFVAPRLGISAGLVTVDHGLQDGSAEHAQRVAAIGYELGFDPVYALPVEVPARGGPEGAAREARYAALASVAGEGHVLLGHTLDDQAESVLLGLGRGSGSRSIAGMRVEDGCWVRPFLGVRRATTAAACTALGLEPWDDPHNADPSYRRVRLRREVLPLLEDVLAGGVAESLARTADQLRDDADALDAWASAILGSSLINWDESTPGRSEFPVDQVKELPKAVRTRVLRAWAARCGAEPLTAERTATLDALITDWHGQGPIELPGRFEVTRTSDRLVARPTPRE